MAPSSESLSSSRASSKTTLASTASAGSASSASRSTPDSSASATLSMPVTLDPLRAGMSPDRRRTLPKNPSAPLRSPAHRRISWRRCRGTRTEWCASGCWMPLDTPPSRTFWRPMRPRPIRRTTRRRTSRHRLGFLGVEHLFGFLGLQGFLGLLGRFDFVIQYCFRLRVALDASSANTSALFGSDAGSASTISSIPRTSSSAFTSDAGIASSATSSAAMTSRPARPLLRPQPPRSLEPLRRLPRRQ